MQRKSFDKMECPVARSLERVGEWWSILIMRDAIYGMTRFDQFQKNLNIAPNMLTRRLAVLVEAGLLEKRLYSEKPPRYEYIVTRRGRDFRAVLWSLQSWGNRHFAPEGESVVLIDKETGERADPILVDRILSAYGIATIPIRAARTAKEAGDHALEFLAGGHACAVKILSPDIVHKSDVGGVPPSLSRRDIEPL